MPKEVRLGSSGGSSSDAVGRSLSFERTVRPCVNVYSGSGLLKQMVGNNALSTRGRPLQQMPRIRRSSIQTRWIGQTQF